MNGDGLDERLVQPGGRRRRGGTLPLVLVVRMAEVCRFGFVVDLPGVGSSSFAVFGDEGVVGYQEEGAGEYADDGDDEGGEVGAGVVAAGGKGGGRGEDYVAPLWAVYAANPC